MFVSYWFIAFILGLGIVYYLIPKRLQWGLLLLASFGFYTLAGWTYLIFLVVTASTVYLAALRISHHDEVFRAMDKNKRKIEKLRYAAMKKRLMLLCLFLNLGILAVTKYTAFVITNLDSVLPKDAQVSVPDLIIPLGISFYTFQAVGYLLDVYWGKCEAQTNYFRFLLFVSFFPQLIQGPISRYGDLSKTLYTPHRFDRIQVYMGLERIAWGYFKKLVIADRIAPAVVALTGGAKHYTGGYVLITMVFWAIELYADFTGGIDITIGIAQALGIRVQENFERPFFSKDITEYWRRWHISMGTWFRDYVFYPFSISRPLRALTKVTKKRVGMVAAKRVAVYLSTIIVWVATGIWHGAAWHFVAWGLVNGVILLITGEMKPLYEKFHKKFPKLTGSWGYALFQIARTFLLMSCIRLFDVYNSAKLAIRQFGRMFSDVFSCPVQGRELMDMGLSYADYAIVAAGVVMMTLVSIASRKEPLRERIGKKPYVIRYAVFLFLLLSTIMLGKYGAGVDAAQFIYNQF